MKPRTVSRARWLFAAAVATAAAVVAAAPQRTTPKFYDDDPVSTLADTQDASKVQPWDISLTYDSLINLFGRPGEQTVGRAKDINTIDEVPDSSWYTNRRRMTPEEMARGVDDDTGPAPGAGQWAVSRKANGVSPGFTITDARGKRYYVKFDPPGWPELSTGAEVVVTRFYHALGYYVPQANLAALRREYLVVARGTTVTLPGGGRRPMRESDIDDQLSRAQRSPDGSYRAIMSEALPGTPLGGFKYEGTRPDDPNDVIPHEDRRELRGLRVFGAWVNHTDAKAINSLDTLIAENGRNFVRHNLLDFGSTLGSGGIGPAERRDGYEYIAEPRTALPNIPTFGFHPRTWMRIKYPNYPSIGRFESAHFVPEQWRPRMPNPAFVRSRADDTFWAARKLMGITEEAIRAVVKTGKYSDARAERYLADTLIDRRNKIGRAWLTAVNPIVDPELGVTGWLTFHNAAVELAGAKPPSGYKAVWQQFDNATGEVRQITETTSSNERIRVPDGLPGETGAFVRVDVAATGGPDPSWAKPVSMYFKRTGQGWTLVGFDRRPDARPMRPGLVGAEPAPVQSAK